MRNGINNDPMFVGPLNINRRMGKATTVMGAELELNEQELETLHTLAANEGEPIAFELLYNEIWNSNGECNRIEVLQSVAKLQAQVEKTGKGFMWIDHSSDGYLTFQTRWGHNWKAQPQKPQPINIIPMETTPKRKRRNPLLRAAISAASLAAATALVLIFSPVLNRPPEYIDLPDDPVPLGPMPYVTPAPCEECEYCEYCEEPYEYCECDE